MAQPTVSFDAEDLPPPSYYQRVKENVPANGAQTAALQYPTDDVNSDSSDDAPLMTHGKVKTVEDIGAGINKAGRSYKSIVSRLVLTSSPYHVLMHRIAEWWKAPEFVPRSLQVPPDGDASLGEEICAPVAPYDCLDPEQALFSHDSYGDLDRSMADRLSVSTPILTPPPIGMPRLVGVRPPQAAPFFPVWAQGQRPLPALMPPRVFPLRLNATTAAAVGFKPAASSVPAGYSANFTTLNAGLGPPIPAIVLKKKRKKKNRKLKGLSLTDVKDDEDDRSALLNGNDGRADRGSSCDSAGDLRSLSKSEVDIMAVQEQQDCLDVVAQNGPVDGAADACSCPDLTEAQRRQLLDEFNAQMDHFEMQSNPVVQQALQDLLANDGKVGAGIRSPRVKELDRQVLKEMQRQWEAEGKRCPLVDSEGAEEQPESSNCLDLYNAFTSDLCGANGQEDCFRGQPVKSIREEIEEKTFFQHRPQWHSLNSDVKSNGNRPLSTVVQYQAGSFVTEVNSENPAVSLTTRRLSRLIPRATFVEDEMADDETNAFTNAADSEEIDFPNVRQTVYPYQALPTNCVRQTVVLQRRHSIPDVSEPFFRRKARVCCALM